MNKVLDLIIEKKHADLEEQKKKLSEEEMKKKAVSKSHTSEFSAYIMHPKKNDMAFIAEIKLASPTIAALGYGKDVAKIARLFEEANADAISFITEKHYFKGDTSFIPQIKNVVDIPVLQKDFVIDPYQIYEAKEIGSDALLLIARIISPEKLKELVSLCQELDVEPVVEIHNEGDLEKAVASSPSIIAVNARDLDTFTVDISKACNLLKKIPDKFIKLGFSGIKSLAEVEQYKSAGAVGVLVGTSLMQAQNVQNFIKSLRIN